MTYIKTLHSLSDKAFNPLDILSKFDWSESEDIEFKSAKGGLPRSLWETYSAMANTKGGVILLGVEDNGIISGLSDVAKIKKNFWDGVNNRNQVSINILSSTDVQEVRDSNCTILIVRVPRANRYDRPIYVGQNPLKGTFRRNYEGDYRCNEHEVSRMLADRAEHPIDSRILDQFTVEDLDAASIQQYRQRFASHKPTHPWLNEDLKEFLFKIGGWRRCRESGCEGPTIAGILMFGREETLREAVPQYFVDYREMLTSDPKIRWTDRLIMDGTWSGNLYQFYNKVTLKISSDLKLPFQLDSQLYRKGETIVHEAIREAFVNSLIHADYFGIGGIIIEKHIDRLEFSNPGSLLISLEQILQGNFSECRNKILQNMFTLIGAAERAGSGIDKIHSGWNSQHWRSPIIREQMQPDRVQLILPMISLLPDESLERLKLRFGKKFHKFTSLEIQALVSADLEGWIDNARMRQITSEHPSDITKLLQNLVSQGILIQDGQRRWTRYRLPFSNDDSVHKAFHSVHKAFHSVHKAFHSVHNSDITEGEWDILKKIAMPAKVNRRLSPTEMELILIKLCEHRWLSRKQLSELVERNSDSLRSRFLTDMVEKKILRLRYPDKPNRVDQAYTIYQK